MKDLFALILIATLCMGCGASKNEAAPKPEAHEIQTLPTHQRLDGGIRALPFAYIYKTDGDYSNHVMANFDSATGRFISFPGPGDVSVDTSPMRLADGWLLDRQGGVSDNTVFLKWTYEQYHNLAAVPSIEQLKAAIIPGARITEIKRLDMTSHAAQSDTTMVNDIIRSWR